MGIEPATLWLRDQRRIPLGNLTDDGPFQGDEKLNFFYCCLSVEAETTRLNSPLTQRKRRQTVRHVGWGKGQSQAGLRQVLAPEKPILLHLLFNELQLYLLPLLLPLRTSLVCYSIGHEWKEGGVGGAGECVSY